MKVKLILVSCAALLGMSVGLACNQDDGVHCCKVQMLCSHCENCPPASGQIGNSEDNCELWLEDPDNADGCPSYRGDQAEEDCS